jgi:phenylalanyl-tRNA synthetase beta chain
VGKRPVDIYDVKADVEALAAPRRVSTEAAPHPALHPGRSARVLIDGAAAGWLGELHPRLARHYELPRAPVVFELDLAPLLTRGVPKAAPVSRLPVVRRDMAMVFDDKLPAQDVLAALIAAKSPHVDTIQLFDVYAGQGIEPGKKSLAILVLMQDTERTLTDAEIDATIEKMVRLIADRFGGTLRS